MNQLYKTKFASWKIISVTLLKIEDKNANVKIYPDTIECSFRTEFVLLRETKLEMSIYE